MANSWQTVNYKEVNSTIVERCKYLNNCVSMELRVPITMEIIFLNLEFRITL